MGAKPHARKPLARVAIASVYVTSIRSPTFTGSSRRGSRAVTVTTLPFGPFSVTVPFFLLRPTTVAVTVVWLPAAAPGLSPGLARPAVSTTLTPGVASPGFLSVIATDS